MSVVSRVVGHLPEILVVLFVGGVIGTLADYAYEWLFDDDSWMTNAIVVAGITLSVVLPLIAHLVRRAGLEDTETSP
jgi:hypothetical protein